MSKDRNKPLPEAELQILLLKSDSEKEFLLSDNESSDSDELGK